MIPYRIILPRDQPWRPREHSRSLTLSLATSRRVRLPNTLNSRCISSGRWRLYRADIGFCIARPLGFTQNGLCLGW